MSLRPGDATVRRSPGTDRLAHVLSAGLRFTEQARATGVHHNVPDTLPQTNPNQGRLLIGELDDRVLTSCGSLLAQVQARKANLAGMYWALLTEMLYWGNGDCMWDYGGGEYGQFQETYMTDAYSALKATLRPHGDTSGIINEDSLWPPKSVSVGFDEYSEWEELIASIFPNEVVVRKQTLDHTAKGCTLSGGKDTTQMRGMKWHVIDMDLEALERWSERIESRAERRFRELFSTFQNMDEEDYDVFDEVEKQYEATRNAD